MPNSHEMRHNAAAKRFELEHEGLLSVADYYDEPGILVVTHVGVPPSQRGQGLASSIAAGVVEFARRENLKIRPLCSFMVAYFKRHPQESDLLAEPLG